jgi:hypothetical protein
LTAPSDPLRIGSIEEGELEGDSPPEEVAAKIRVGGADPVVHAEWITLHDSPGFRDFVEFLRAELGRRGVIEFRLICVPFFPLFGKLCVLVFGSLHRIGDNTVPSEPTGELDHVFRGFDPAIYEAETVMRSRPRAASRP